MQQWGVSEGAKKFGMIKKAVNLGFLNKTALKRKEEYDQITID